MRRLLSIVVLLASVITMYGANAQPGAVLVNQSDGTQLFVYGHGDEYFSWYTTSDGVILSHIGNDFFVADINSDGMVIPTKMLAHELSMRSDNERILVNNQNRSAFYKFTQTSVDNRRKQPVRTTTSHFPHTGTPKVLVILVDFADEKFSHSDEDTKLIFNQYFNADGSPTTGNSQFDTTEWLSRNYGSAKKYFKDMSFGQFVPEFDIYGPVHLTKKLAYYGANSDKEKDVNYLELIPDACKAIDAEVNFSQYDSNNDGYADLVYIIYAGYAESMSGNSSDCLWPKSGTTSTGGTYDGVKVMRFGINNELNATPADAKNAGHLYLNGIGLFCHEFSHCMGLPDFYATESSVAGNNVSMEYYSLMDLGEYTNNGYRPTAYTAWEREAMEWMQIVTLDTAGTYDMCALADVSEVDNAFAYRINNPQDETGNECYILENIQHSGWNYYLGTSGNYAHGMMITHVDYDERAFYYSNSVNNTVGHPRMTVIPADGTLVSNVVTPSMGKQSMPGDLFPGTTDSKSFSYTITPSADGTISEYTSPIVYNGTVEEMSKQSVLNIKEEDGVISFVYISSSATGISNIFMNKKSSDRLYNIQGQMIENDYECLPHGIYIHNGKKVIR